MAKKIKVHTKSTFKCISGKQHEFHFTPARLLPFKPKMATWQCIWCKEYYYSM